MFNKNAIFKVVFINVITFILLLLFLRCYSNQFIKSVLMKQNYLNFILYKFSNECIFTHKKCKIRLMIAV